MRSVFDNLASTLFGNLSKSVLDDSVLKNNVLDNLSPQTGGKYKDYEEAFFESFNTTNKVKRYYQALYYGENKKKEKAYGMECNAATLMYFLQSLGLFPPEMTRKEFEYAFTTLSPYTDNQKTKSITIDGVEPYKFDLVNDILTAQSLNLKPINLIDSNILSTNALLGGKLGISLVGMGQTLKTAINKLEAITKKFTDLPYLGTQKGKYDTFKKYHRSIVA